MTPGKYPYRAVFTVPDGSRDDIGNESGQMTTLGRAWVSLLPMTVSEFLRASGESSKATHKVTLQHPGFEVPASATMTTRGRSFDVVGPLGAPRDSEITLLVVEKR